MHLETFQLPTSISGSYASGEKKEFYIKTYLFFGLTTAPFIFNFFAKVLYWIIAFYLK